MERSGPRVPSAFWVLVPGLLLALAGARAVLAESRRAQDETRDRARLAAERAARAVETLADEYAGPLPAADSNVSLDAFSSATRHLRPALALTRTGGRIETESPAPPSGDEARDAAVLADVRAVLDADDAPSPDQAALLAAGAAEAVATPWVAAELRIRAAQADLGRDAPDAALRVLAPVLAEDPRRAERTARPGADGAWITAARLVVRALDVADVSGRAADVDEALLARAALEVAADPFGLDDVDRTRLVAELLSHVEAPAARRDATSRSADLERLREHVRGLRASPTDVALLAWDRRPTLFVLRRVQLSDAPADVAWIGGAVPNATFERRVTRELEELRAEGVSVRLRAPAGSVEASGDSAPAADDVVHAAPLAHLAGWSVEARAPAPTTLPPGAVVLAAAVLLATLSLGGGALVLARAARHHARLAEERRSFLDHVAHEVRTPTAALLALSEELASGHVPAERVATYHAHLANEARRLADLVEETLDLARLEGGRLVATREELDVRDVVREAIDALRLDAAAVHVELPATPVVVRADRGALRRALRNLLRNAVTHGASARPAELRVAQEGGDVVVSVRDFGRGIPPEHLARVFERFHRVPSATHEVKGVGLGLALVREVARAHGGDAGVVSTPGAGSTFTLRIAAGGAA